MLPAQTLSIRKRLDRSPGFDTPAKQVGIEWPQTFPTLDVERPY